MTLRRYLLQAVVFAVAILLIPLSTMAAKVTLKTGQVLEGKITEAGDNYWIKFADGSSRLVPKRDVAKYDPADEAPPAAATPPAGSTPATGPATKPTVRKPAQPFDVVKRRADLLVDPLAGVVIWLEYIDSVTDEALKEKGRAEKVIWEKRAEDKAERLGTKWVGGQELQDIKEKATRLREEGIKMLDNRQLFQALGKFDEAVKVYPNDVQLHFFQGLVALLTVDDNDKRSVELQYNKAIRSFREALRLEPNMAEAWNNIGFAEWGRRQPESAILAFHQAVTLKDDKTIAMNLINAIDAARINNDRTRKAREAARLLAIAHGLQPNGGFTPMTFPREAPPSGNTPGGQSDPSGVRLSSSGSGSIISQDGLIITNRHVVEGAKKLMVFMGDQKRNAELVAIDDQQDLALIRITPEKDEKLPFVSLALPDNPKDASEIVIMGFPLGGRMGWSVKTTKGIVASGDKKSTMSVPDVVLDAKVNPGNSGGPVFDDRGSLMAVVAMKTIATQMEDSYGLAISAGRVRTFLAKHKVSGVATVKVAGEGKALSPEEIAAKNKTAVVAILNFQ